MGTFLAARVAVPSCFLIPNCTFLVPLTDLRDNQGWNIGQMPFLFPFVSLANSASILP